MVNQWFLPRTTWHWLHSTVIEFCAAVSKRSVAEECSFEMSVKFFLFLNLISKLFGLPPHAKKDETLYTFLLENFRKNWQIFEKKLGGGVPKNAL